MDVEKNQRMIEYMKQNSYGYNKTLTKENNSEDDHNKLSIEIKKLSKSIEEVSKKTNNQEKTELKTDQEIIDEEIEKYSIRYLLCNFTEFLFTKHSGPEN